MIARIALIGLSGAGKTTVAPLLAERLGFAWDDLDEVIERSAGSTVGELIEERGEAAFREMEGAALRDLLGDNEPTGGLVLACGAGVPTREENRLLLRRVAFTVWLSITPRAAARRLEGGQTAWRPLLLRGGTIEERLSALLAQRRALYEAVADATIETDRRTPAEVAEAIEVLGKRRRGWAPSGS